MNDVSAPCCLKNRKRSVFVVLCVTCRVAADAHACVPSHVRVVDVEQPVETHVDAQRDVNQVLVFLLQVVVHGGETVNDLGDAELRRVHAQFVLLEHGLGDRQV